ncbi:MAG: PPC domain-containing protein [Pirellulales bacterium]
MTCRKFRPTMVRGLLVASIVCGPARLLAAAPPTISNLSLRGLQAGGTTTLVVEGSDLLPEPRLVLPVPVAQQTVKEGATANRLEIEVTLDAGVMPGIHQLRLATAGGISDAVGIAVDHLPELPFAPEIASLPVALTGRLEGSTVLRTSFTGTKGQSIVAEVEGRRLGGEFNPVLWLYDSRNVQLAWAQSRPIFGVARLVVELPVDGRYSLELHDATFRGPAPGHFRLKIGALYYADMVYPLAVRRGTKTRLEFVSTNLPGSLAVESGDVPAPGPAPVPWPAVEGLSGAQPGVVHTDYEELLETAAAEGQLQQLTPPMAVSGRLSAAGEEDRYQINAPAGTVLKLDVLADRVGSQLDGVLSVRNAAGAELANSDDRPGTADPGLDFTVPAGVDSIVVAITDRQRGGGAEFIYRLAAIPAGRPDFSLDLLATRLPLPRMGSTVVRVRANRAGYNGPIKLTVPGLPAGVSISGDEIPAGATDTLLSVSAGDQVVPPALTSVIGKSTEEGVSLERVARLPETMISKHQPWLRGELALSGAQPLPLALAWGGSDEARLPLGASLPTEIVVTRNEPAAGPVRLSLLTSQIVPKKTIKENDQDKQVDDTDRALRIEGTPMIAADQSTAAVNLLVPGDLPNIPYDLAIQADLLADDGKTVLASATTPARRLVTTQPLTIELAGEPKVEAKAGSGETGVISGKVQRLGTFNQPVSITLEGLPPHLPAPQVELAADQNDFSLSVSFPYGSTPGEVPNVKVVAIARLNPQLAVKSNEIPVAVNIVPGGPPPALYQLFEDEPHFLALLTEGGGQVTLEPADHYTGQAAFKVTPDQRFRASLPGLGLKIVENPGEGEYRYLRFAWKKRTGSNVMLQLNANGNWGPLRGEPSPAYRYEAGPGDNPYKAAAIKIDEKLPESWVAVTRDLFADFGAFSLDGLAFTASDGEHALFDHVYLARTADDLQGCPQPPAAEQPLAVFEDQPEFVANLGEGDGTAALFADEKYSGAASVKVTPGQRYNPALPGLGVKIREEPGVGEYRFLRFAWKKQGGERICLQLNHDGKWGPQPDNPGKFRYDAGPAQGESYGAALRIDQALPSDFVVVTRDLFADFGEFTLTGIALSPQDGEYALFDHIYLGRGTADFDLVKP